MLESAIFSRICQPFGPFFNLFPGIWHFQSFCPGVWPFSKRLPRHLTFYTILQRQNLKTNILSSCGTLLGPSWGLDRPTTVSGFLGRLEAAVLLLSWPIPPKMPSRAPFSAILHHAGWELPLVIINQSMMPSRGGTRWAKYHCFGPRVTVRLLSLVKLW